MIRHEATARRGRSPWSRILVALLLAHIVWGAVRIPGKVIGERIGKVAEYREMGPVRFHLDNRYRTGAAVVQHVLAHTGPDAVLLHAGAWRGAVEFAAPLLAPRLLVAGSVCPPGALEYLGRPLARGPLPDGSTGVWVLVGHGDHLELRVR